MSMYPSAVKGENGSKGVYENCGLEMSVVLETSKATCLFHHLVGLLLICEICSCY